MEEEDERDDYQKRFIGIENVVNDDIWKIFK